MLLVSVSVAVSVWLPDRLERHHEQAGAAGQASLAGSTAWASLLVIWTVPA